MGLSGATDRLLFVTLTFAVPCSCTLMFPLPSRFCSRFGTACAGVFDTTTLLGAGASPVACAMSVRKTVAPRATPTPMSSSAPMIALRRISPPLLTFEDEEGRASLRAREQLVAEC
jgi:hypothetical protein